MTPQFTQPLVFNTSIKREMVGYYSPQAQYIVVDVYVRYNDKLVEVYINQTSNFKNIVLLKEL